MRAGRFAVLLTGATTALVSIGLLAPVTAAATSCPGPTQSGGKQTVTFCYTGAPQTWTVPAGVTSVTFDLFGAQGGGSYAARQNGGKGAETKETIAVTPGSTVGIFIGGQGADGTNGTTTAAGGFNGGGVGGNSGTSAGGGGGATDIRIGGLTLTNRRMVAAGGGGGSSSNGGAGGDLTGTSGSGCTGTGQVPAGGGTQTGGGAAGQYSSTNAVENGMAGALGQGGAGANGPAQDQGGGGGGGGYYGGGGGGDYCGGGGGSSKDPVGIMIPGVRAGSGVLAVTYALALPGTSAPAPSVPWLPIGGLAIGLGLVGLGLMRRRRSA
jgi:hypothetical protein